MELLTGKNTEYEELQKTVVALIEKDPKDGLDSKRYQRDMARDRAAQAMAMRLTRIEQEASALYARIVESFEKAAAKQTVDYDALKKDIGEFLGKAKTWSDVEDGLFEEFPLLQNVTALTFFVGKYDQLSEKRTHVRAADAGRHGAPQVRQQVTAARSATAGPSIARRCSAARAASRRRDCPDAKTSRVGSASR